MEKGLKNITDSSIIANTFNNYFINITDTLDMVTTTKTEVKNKNFKKLKEKLSQFLRKFSPERQTISQKIKRIKMKVVFFLRRILLFSINKTTLKTHSNIKK